MDRCPCGSEKDYSLCCQSLINGDRDADTAEALMRSRYSAHAKQAFDYIFDTTLPANRQDADRKSTAAWSRKLDWQRLEVRRIENGGPEDVSGIVEFVARYRKDGRAFDHHEVAEFVREDGRWFYKDGQAPQQVQAVRQGPKVGRNDPCTCGSGKKYKKCCGM
jgi:SEC-C motif-containing protein